MASIKAKQGDLRRLMKERRENLKDQKIKIDSPFAKYNASGQLFCTICNVQIKNNGLWAPHVAGKVHKENALKKKKAPSEIASSIVQRVAEKRALDIEPTVTKKIKVDISECPPPSPPKAEPVKDVGKISLLDAYSSSSEDESDSPPPESSSNIVSTNSLPKDFFDAAPSISGEQKDEKSDTSKEKNPVNSVEALPEGFFDDPVMDAKARNIEYKDPVEEEWEKFQKAIAEETNVSKTIIEDDLEESTLERDITEIDLQINLWGKSKTLQSMAEEASTSAPATNENNASSGASEDELDEDDLLDWRSKGVKKR